MDNGVSLPPKRAKARSAHDDLAEHEPRYGELFTRTALPQALTDADGRFVMADAAYCDLVGYSDVELFTRTFAAMTHPDDLPEQQRLIEDLLAGRRQVARLSKRYLRGDGAVLRARLCLGVVRDSTGAVRYLHGAIEQVRPLGRGSASRRQRPTVLPTAAPARDQLGKHLATLRASRLQIALIRLGGLERMAGVIGWTGVDAVHAKITERMAGTAGLGIRTIVPVGMSDLLVLADAADAGGLAAVLHAVLSPPLTLSGVHLPMNLRIGVTSGGLGDDPETLLRQARAALNAALDSGAPEVRYDPSLDSRMLDEFALTGEIAYALAHDEFTLHYQPKYRLDPLELVGVEALLRWAHSERGAVPPGRVVALAESAGLITPLTCWVIDTAAAQAAAWRNAGTPVPVAVNISPGMLANPSLPLRLSQAVTRHNLPTRSLELEITETALATAPHAVTAVHRLTDLGYRVSVDDFGTGYSSLAAIKALPLHAVKIDQGFIRQLARDERDQAVVAGIIEITHRLGGRVVAEGVEDAQTLDLLSRMHCDEAQGYHLGPPQPADQLAPNPYPENHQPGRRRSRTG